MEKTLNITWLLLLFLTITSLIFSNPELQQTASILMGLAILKIIGVAFYFMELRRAHLFWKLLLIFFLLLLCAVLLLL
ncbi:MULTISPECIES: cytochrome C oxidase subunit IV family protein [Altibacter]|uniref:cytochrome C oxidase subunit IV family protein n=1 Tax=Altibacter TaxID=1535231 RepID=UPI00055880C6|nr:MULTISPECIES: cytochrome C oxidase subunit IV family protein [Altibacter]MCW8981959.1 cytochrome C oxidase subunit IV family protein [Altibacter sp.]MCW9037287.1 cytochrome C oxidase subunit IV family protein [Altibacter sp.]